MLFQLIFNSNLVKVLHLINCFTGQYEQNLCKSSDNNCQLCPNRLPPCIGIDDGEHEFPNRLWQRDFIICYKNRTISITECEDGFYFNPRTKRCQKAVEMSKYFTLLGHHFCA